MRDIDELAQHAGETVTGQYLLTRVEKRSTQYQAPYKALHLEDATDRVVGYVWERTGLLESVPLTTPTVVEVALRPRRLNHATVADVTAIRCLETHEVANAARLLPYTDCPQEARSALAILVRFVESLQPAVLRSFLNRVLLEPGIAATLTSCKASQGHHHAISGGLLIHSIEVMQIASDMAGARLDADDLAVTKVAALLHDLGKLRAVGSGSVRPVHCRLVRHEAQTTRLLDAHLLWLKERAPKLWAGLEYTLDFLADHSSSRGYAKFVGADIVVASDRMSAALAKGKQLSALVEATIAPSAVIESAQTAQLRE